MISSEVQRTLVKSPPELWAELSDPDALARHLGELGEIKIIRIEPEKLVEWEAEGTTGTVAIKPSGWGTKVTLTVSRELPAAEIAEDAAESEENDAGEDASEPENFEPTESAPEGEITSDAKDLQVEPTPHGAEPVATDPVPEPQEPKPAPATEAARRAAGWPAASAAPGPAIESDLPAAEASEQRQTAGLAEWSAGLELSAEAEPTASESTEPEPEPIAANPQPEPRRGFFARLFGGKRRRTAVASAPLQGATTDPESSAAGEPDSEPPDDTEPEATPLAAAVLPEPEPLADAVLPEPEPLADAVLPEPEPLADAVLPNPEPLADAFPPEREGLADAAPETASEAPDEDELLPELVVEPSSDDVAEPSEPQAVKEAGEALAAEVSAAEPDPLETETRGSDLAAELRAAEEVAAEEVEAVLTGVLDRLGAAHHRPFSRS